MTERPYLVFPHRFGKRDVEVPKPTDDEGIPPEEVADEDVHDEDPTEHEIPIEIQITIRGVLTVQLE